MTDAPSPSPSLVILAVADLARSRRFYLAAFGWPIQVDVPVYVELATPAGPGLGLYQREAFARNLGASVSPGPVASAGPSAVAGSMDAAGSAAAAGTSASHCGITGTELYLRSASFDRDLERLRATGVPELSPPALRDWGEEVAYFADPDGNVIALARLIP